MPAAIVSDLCAALRGLASDSAAPQKARNRAAALLQRLTTPIKIAVSGPDVVSVADLLHALPARLCDAAISEAMADADIVVWCTQNFDEIEMAYWEDAPASVQDHGLLVGPDDGHIRDMGATYFRNHGTAEQAAAILQRQIAQAREADADQALALLARHPATPVAVGPCTPALQTPADPGLIAYLQAQADRLMGLDVTGTPESCHAVLTLCQQTVQHLGDLVTTLPDRALHDAVFDATDAITLMQIEGDVGAAADAVTLLIDLRARFQGAVSQFETIAVQ